MNNLWHWKQKRRGVRSRRSGTYGVGDRVLVLIFAEERGDESGRQLDAAAFVAFQAGGGRGDDVVVARVPGRQRRRVEDGHHFPPVDLLADARQSHKHRRHETTESPAGETAEADNRSRSTHPIKWPIRAQFQCTSALNRCSGRRCLAKSGAT